MNSWTRKEDTVGNVSWFNKEGILHRENGPAIEHANGLKEWIVNGRRHRTDGPAIEWNENIRGKNEWWYNGEKIDCSSQAEFEQKVRFKPSVLMYGIRCICLIDPLVHHQSAGRGGWTKTDRGWETWYVGYKPSTFNDINEAYTKCAPLTSRDFLYCVEEDQ